MTNEIIYATCGNCGTENLEIDESKNTAEAFYFDEKNECVCQECFDKLQAEYNEKHYA